MTVQELDGLRKQFLFYKSLADKTIQQISPSSIFEQPHIDSNSIAIIMQHMAGNMLSRWTDFLTSDGEKPWRNRDSEFEMLHHDYERLLAYWEEGWACLWNAIQPLQIHNLQQFVFIRNQQHTVTEALYRQLAHYAYHVGQIVYIGKMITQQPWQSLSIPKGQSATYNATKSQQNNTQHYTDEFLPPRP